MFTEEHQLFRKTVRTFCEKELAPHTDEWDKAGLFPREVFQRAGELGLLGINKGEDVGGAGLDYWYTVAYAESLAYSRNAGVNMALMVQSDMATPIIDEIGSDEVKQEFLAPAIAGEKIAALGVTEPGVGSDVANLATTARKDGDDYVINGQKTFITNGTRADFITLAVRTGEEGFGGISFVVVPTDVKGYSVSRKLEKMGNLASDTAEIFFDDVRIPQRYRLGDENAGFYHIMTNFQGERLIAAITAVSGMELMIRDAIAYGFERKAFGRPIVKFQVWRHRFAELLTQVEAARQLTYYACDKFDRGEMATKEISMAKLYAGDLIQKVAYECQQFHGGYGYVMDYDIARAFRDVRLITIGGGTSEVMKEILSKLEGM
ncbi:MAG: acyl-CoA dehydrogenase family protein [Deltaproteobacteria bacterium]|nr:acyl-CoA dehydrogenase family protein [Deltaproteobacteria bacterium]